ncbi:MAG: hypothetical protein K2P81_14965 [Bacteriovoracaceae bacterium]|nr:hypothetical protein [Bacteriovoracaceae bacterium]
MKFFWVMLLCVSCAVINDLKVGELGLNSVYEGMTKQQLTPPLETLQVGNLEVLTYFQKFLLFRDGKLLAKHDYQDYDAYRVEIFTEKKQDENLPLSFQESEGDASLVSKAVGYLKTGAEFRKISLANSEKIMNTKVLVSVKLTQAKEPATEYVRTLDLVARDKAGELVWRVTVLSQGESADLAKALPKLVTAAVDAINTPTAGPVEKTIKHTNGLMVVIVERDFINKYLK